MMVSFIKINYDYVGSKKISSPINNQLTTGIVAKYQQYTDAQHIKLMYMGSGGTTNTL
jgi:hypothetical protein